MVRDVHPDRPAAKVMVRDVYPDRPAAKVMVRDVYPDRPAAKVKVRTDALDLLADVTGAPPDLAVRWPSWGVPKVRSFPATPTNYIHHVTRNTPPPPPLNHTKFMGKYWCVRVFRFILAKKNLFIYLFIKKHSCKVI